MYNNQIRMLRKRVTATRSTLSYTPYVPTNLPTHLPTSVGIYTYTVSYYKSPLLQVYWKLSLIFIRKATPASTSRSLRTSTPEHYYLNKLPTYQAKTYLLVFVTSNFTKIYLIFHSLRRKCWNWRIP